MNGNHLKLDRHYVRSIRLRDSTGIIASGKLASRQSAA